MSYKFLFQKPKGTPQTQAIAGREAEMLQGRSGGFAFDAGIWDLDWTFCVVLMLSLGVQAPFQFVLRLPLANNSAPPLAAGAPSNTLAPFWFSCCSLRSSAWPLARLSGDGARLGGTRRFSRRSGWALGCGSTCSLLRWADFL